jgi:CysZ protein
MTQLATGVRDIGRGLGVVRAHPGLWTWIAAPALITAALFAGLIAGIAVLVAPLRAWLTAHLPGVLAPVAGSLVTAAVVVGLAAGALLIFVPLAGIIAGPFNERLSERIEVQLTGRPAPPWSLLGSIHELARGIVHGLRRLWVSLVGLAVVFAVSLAPGIGSVAAVAIAGWLAARAAAYDCYDAVLARRSMSYRDKLSYLARHRQRSFGLGAAVAALLLVPGLNLFALGLGAAGATVAAHAIEHDARRADPRAARSQR